ncbi:MAG TPA: TPM domain-containing protein [Bacteroidia bacterium]|nr:TPM domain-containing protein [Bacteroidia bacterium]HNS11667.1 TPM domain-containing protein [Bacteroidia bacterium]
MSAEGKFTEAERLKIVEAIEAAEKETSGEIRLFVESECGENVLDRAAYIFRELKMHKTKERNGVLFYLAIDSRQFAILGDAGINSKVNTDFWYEIKMAMQNHFTEGDFVLGLSKGVGMTGEALRKHFPYSKDDSNELSNEIVFGKDKARQKK